MLKLAIIVLDGCWGSQLMGILDFVAIHALVAAKHGLPAGVEVQLFGLDRGQVRLGNGLPLTVAALPDKADGDTLCLAPGIEYARLKQQLDAPGSQWARLGDFFSQSQSVLGLSTGSFVAAQTGLLDGRQTLTHWRFAAAMQRRFPRLTVGSGNDLLDHGQAATAASLTGALVWLAQKLQIRQPRQIVSQSLALASQNSELAATLWLAATYPYKQHSNAAILDLQQFIDTHYAEPLTLATLAARIGSSESSLKRHFKQASGISVSRYWQTVRMARMQHLLLNSTTPVDTICYDIGYADPRFARRLFAQSTGLSPRAFRQQEQLG